MKPLWNSLFCLKKSNRLKEMRKIWVKHQYLLICVMDHLQESFLMDLDLKWDLGASEL